MLIASLKLVLSRPTVVELGYSTHQKILFIFPEILVTLTLLVLSALLALALLKQVLSRGMFLAQLAALAEADPPVLLKLIL